VGSAETILDVLGAKRQGESSYLCPRFPECYALFEVYEHPSFGVSVRCTREGCILDAWDWPEWALSLQLDISSAETAKRLLQAARDRRSRVGPTSDIAARRAHPQSRISEVEEARAVVAAFLS
jgi:hypothetical protein